MHLLAGNTLRQEENKTAYGYIRTTATKFSSFILNKNIFYQSKVYLIKVQLKKTTKKNKQGRKHIHCDKIPGKSSAFTIAQLVGFTMHIEFN